MDKAQSSPNFEAWIKGTLVALPDGPLVVHHATGADFTAFNSFPHFGTIEAATNRAKHKNIASPIYIGVYLQIRKPLIYLDDGVANHHGYGLIQARRQGLVTDEDFEEISRLIQQGQRHARDTEEHNRLKWENTAAAVAAVVGRHGYDGLVYENVSETGKSWVPFRTDQIWWTDRDQPEP